MTKRNLATVMLVGAAVMTLGGGLAGASTVPPETVPPETVPPTTVPAPIGISEDAVRDAKVGWSRFVADHFATPTSIIDACPLVAPESAPAQIAALGLVPSARPSGVSLYRDVVGTGIIGIACGVDLSKSADPTGSTAYSVEVTLLDGQAVFPQHVVRVAGSNTPITPSAELNGETIARCRDEPRVCVASWHLDGLVVTIRLDGPRTDQSVDQVHRVLLAVVPEVVANLAALGQ